LKIPVVDLFAGAGGLGEGFIAANAGFEVDLSVESNPHAAKTLLFRAFYHRSKEVLGKVPEEYYQVIRGELSFEKLYEKYSQIYEYCRERVDCKELGENEYSRHTIHRKIKKLAENNKHWVLLGGPPCQAYSKVGRARNKGIKGYDPAKDNRHFLYLEYLSIIANNWPSVFIMENVPGLLSSKVNGESMFNKILEDLVNPSAIFPISVKKKTFGYKLYSLCSRSLNFGLFGNDLDNGKNFVVESEKYGIPQKRHRVIIVGVRSDIDNEPALLEPSDEIVVEDVLSDLPRIRSGLTKEDSNERWVRIIKSAQKEPWWHELDKISDQGVMNLMSDITENIKPPKRGVGAPFLKSENSKIKMRKKLNDWFIDGKVGGFANHESKSHMDSDIYRYLFLSCLIAYRENLASKTGVSFSTKISDFPQSLLPKHKNVQEANKADLNSVAFANRFNVQRYKAPSSTIVSHIMRDGHYFIHPDPTQCRSLTVREAARLQTFPDNYFMCGPRTEQFRQVGNAVPPLLAKQVAYIIASVLS